MRPYILFLITVMALVSCVEKITMDPKERVVVVDCILEDKEIQSLTLRYSSYFTEDYGPSIEDAEITVKAYQKSKEGYLKAGDYRFYRVNEDGVWVSRFTPKAGYKYELEIIVPEMDTVTATTIYLSESTLLAIDNLYK